jgi:hypothetical protein
VVAPAARRISAAVTGKALPAAPTPWFPPIVDAPRPGAARQPSTAGVTRLRIGNQRVGAAGREGLVLGSCSGRRDRRSLSQRGDHDDYELEPEHTCDETHDDGGEPDHGPALSVHLHGVDGE